jgi:hypothetical protein
MNGTGRFGDQRLGPQPFAAHHRSREKIMTSAMTVFGIAVGGTSLICFLLMTRLQNGRRNRASASDASGPDGQYAGGDGGGVLSWFGASHSVSGDSCASSGGGDSRSGGDGGGGGGD